MSEVRRYDVQIYQDGQSEDIESPTGKWVLASDHAARVQELERERDEAARQILSLRHEAWGLVEQRNAAQARVDALMGSIAEEMEENVKLFQRLGVEAEIKAGTAGTEAVTKAVAQLQATLAEREEQLRLANIDQANTEAALNDVRQDAARLREALELALVELLRIASANVKDWDTPTDAKFKAWAQNRAWHTHAQAQRALKGA